jgi:isoquinoline 1-oxidoreductase
MKQNPYPIEAERYELLRSYCEPTEMTRREMLKLLGGGLLVMSVGTHLVTPANGQRTSGQQQVPQSIAAWIHIGKDGRILAYTGKTEVGQDIRTSLAQAVAEELGVQTESISLVMADTDLVPYDQGTFGSRSTPTMSPQLRRAAAATRDLLISIASEKLRVDKSSLYLEGGAVRRADGSQTIAFSDLASEVSLDRVIDDNVPLTNASEWKVMGKPQRKLNAREIVTGSHRYSSDIRKPGTLYAKVLRPPSIGATLLSVDTSAAESMPDVHVVKQGDFVAVAAPSARLAEKALLAIKAEWNESIQPSNRDLYRLLRGTSPRREPPAGLKPLDATYNIAFIAHAPLETRAAFAETVDGKLVVYTGTQRPFGVKAEIVAALRLPEDRVRVIVPDTGSGYGGKHTGDAAVEAARITHAIGRPVSLVWTREEEFTFAYFRPAGVIEVSGAIGDDGKIVHWEHDNYNSGASGIGIPYSVPNPRTQFHQTRSPLRQGSYRTLAATANNFARESHIDDMAQSAGIDPLEFRLMNLSNARLRAVLQSVANQFAWGKERSSSRRGFGIACGTEKGSYVANAVEIEIDRLGDVHVVRAVTAFECGAIVNPDHLKGQVEGCVIMGIGGALFEQIEFENGKILTNRFSRYRVPRFVDVPAMETILLDRKDLPSAGGGETPIIGIAPAIGNAIFASTGNRIRELPMAPAGVR